MTIRRKIQLRIFGIFLLAILTGAVAYPKMISFYPPVENILNQLTVALGLDLQGGVHLEYEARVGDIPTDQRDDAVNAAQAVIERRVNAFGVGEALVQNVRSGENYRIIVEIPGVKDIEEAKDMIRETPTLEFKEERAEDDPEVIETLAQINAPSQGKAREVLDRAKGGEDFVALAKEFSFNPEPTEEEGIIDFQKREESFLGETFGSAVYDGNMVAGTIYPEVIETDFGWHVVRIEEVRGEGEGKEVKIRQVFFQKYTQDFIPDLQYQSTELTGRNLEGAIVDFGGAYGMGEPRVVLQFDGEGARLFKELTERNIGKTIAIYIDGVLVTAPVVQTVIAGGTAEITGQYTLEEAQELKSRLDEGALPVPLELVGQQSIEASLGTQDLQMSLQAGLFGIVAVMIYMIMYYRLLGVIAAFALVLYATMLITLFKLSTLPGWDWPITLTLSGIAGFILSVGMAVDANVLIFERIREELRHGKRIEGAIREGFRRAWASIRDSNVSTLLTAGILVWLGTGFVQGFALILTLGVSLSMFTAVVIVRMILKALPMDFLDRHISLIMKRPKS